MLICCKPDCFVRVIEICFALLHRINTNSCVRHYVWALRKKQQQQQHIAAAFCIRITALCSLSKAIYCFLVYTLKWNSI